jgi:hypothetical protein
MAEPVLLAGLETLRNLGFFQFFLPFLLFFAIIYGALQKTKVFGERKDIDAIIALVIALIASTTAWVIEGLSGFLPWVGFIALVIVCFLMLVGMIYGDVEELAKSKWVKISAVIAITVGIFAVLYYALGFNKYFAGTGLGGGLSDADIALVVVGIIGVGALYMIVKGGGPSSSKK